MCLNKPKYFYLLHVSCQWFPVRTLTFQQARTFRFFMFWLRKIVSTKISYNYIWHSSHEMQGAAELLSLFQRFSDIIISKHGNYNLSLCNNIERTQFMALALMVRLLLHVIYYYYFGPNNTSKYTLHNHLCRVAKNVSDNYVRHKIFPGFSFRWIFRDCQRSTSTTNMCWCTSLFVVALFYLLSFVDCTFGECIKIITENAAKLSKT